MIPAHIVPIDHRINGGSYCTATKEFDTLQDGTDTGPVQYCTACMEPEPELTVVSVATYQAIA